MIDTTTLLDNLIAFSPKAEDEDLYVPSTQSTSTSFRSLTSDFIIYSQNVHKRNSTTHTVLSVASSMKPPADLILIQEPYYGKIGTNPKMAQGNPITDVYGCPKHRDWQAILPPSTSPSTPPDVIAYVPSHRTGWTFQLRADIVSHPGILCLEINSSAHPFLVINVYNDVDNSAVHVMKSINNLLPRTLFLGDFNLHHPLWSRDDNLDKTTETADELVHMFAGNGYGILNRKEEETFFINRTLPGREPELYTSTLDLGWASPELHPFVSDFVVAKHLANGSDHYPLLTTLSYAPTAESRDSFLFHDDNRKSWTSAFHEELRTRPTIPQVLSTPDQFNDAVDVLQSATLAASHATCLRRPRAPKQAKWFDSKVREALGDLRKARKRMCAFPTHHNTLRYQVARKQFHYQVVVAKRSHARQFASSVKPGTDLWRLNTWYQGVRKTTVPTLKDPNSVDPRYPTWYSQAPDKATLLAKSWFPNTKPTINPPPHPHPAQPTRTFQQVTEEEVKETLTECASENAPGISGLNYKVWKWAIKAAPSLIVTIVQGSINLGIHHHTWKQSWSL
jgi:hypothetical protein